MAIYFTGDIHGSLDIGKLSTAGLAQAGVKPTGKDYLVICGDFGLVWNWRGQDSEERYWLRWLDGKPFRKILFVDGNHENFERLNAYPVEEWRGGLVHRVADKVLHLMRGQVFDIEGVRLLALGGARSIDRAWRTEGKSWWPQEMPDEGELAQAEAALDACGRRVDAVVTHCAPTMVQYRLNPAFEPDPLTDYLEHLRGTVAFDRWIFGHYHLDRDFAGGFSALYERIVRLEASDGR